MCGGSEAGSYSRLIYQILPVSVSMHNMSMRSSRAKRMAAFARASPASTASCVVVLVFKAHRLLYHSA